MADVAGADVAEEVVAQEARLVETEVEAPCVTAWWPELPQADSAANTATASHRACKRATPLPGQMGRFIVVPTFCIFESLFEF